MGPGAVIRNVPREAIFTWVLFQAPGRPGPPAILCNMTTSVKGPLFGWAPVLVTVIVRPSADNVLRVVSNSLPFSLYTLTQVLWFSRFQLPPKIGGFHPGW